MIHCVALIIQQDQTILQARSHGKDKWFMPGGKIDVGESPQQALIREMREELTIELHPESIEHQFTVEAQAYRQPNGTIVQMQCFTAKFTGEPTASAEIAEIAYFSLDDIQSIAPAGQLAMRRALA